MIRSLKILIATALLCTIAACTPQPNSTFVPPTPQSIQQGVLNTCGYVAEIGPIAQLIAAVVPIPGVSNGVTLGVQLTNEICTQATKAAPAGAVRGAASAPVPVVVRGVTISGYFK